MERVRDDRISDVAPIYDEDKIGKFTCPKCGKEQILPIQRTRKGRCNGTDDDDSHDPMQVEWEQEETLGEAGEYLDHE